MSNSRIFNGSRCNPSSNGTIKTKPSQDDQRVQWDITQISRAIIFYQDSGSWATPDLEASDLAKATMNQWLDAMRIKYHSIINSSVNNLRTEHDSVYRISNQLLRFCEIVSKEIIDHNNPHSDFSMYYSDVINSLSTVLEK